MSWLYGFGRVEEEELNRRRFIKLGASAALAGLMPEWVWAAIENPPSRERSLSLYETHTCESLTTLYWAEGVYLPEALADINYILRDWRTNEIKPIDTQLLDLVYALGLKLEAKQPFHVISGYRSPQTNALLHAKNKGVAKKSLHVYGKAIDLRLPKCSLSKLRCVAVSLKGGGVGYYPRPNFVHVDVGRVRYW